MQVSEIKLTCEWGAPDNPEWMEADGWTCKLRYQGRQMTFPFYMGMGLNGREPGLDDVLHCLLSDWDAGEQSFEEFCSDMGYDEDSRRAEKVWQTCRKAAERTARLFRDKEALAQLVEELEAS